MNRYISSVLACMLVATGSMAAGPPSAQSKAVLIGRGFNPSCLRCLERALEVLHRVANENRRCNWFFRSTGDLRVVKDFLEDSRIRIHFNPVQEYSDEGPTIAYTEEANKGDIYMQPLACQLTRWDLARALIHEFTHITLTPGPRQEGEAQRMEANCGFRRRILNRPVTVTASPSPIPLESVN